MDLSKSEKVGRNFSLNLRIVVVNRWLCGVALTKPTGVQSPPHPDFAASPAGLIPSDYCALEAHSAIVRGADLLSVRASAMRCLRAIQSLGLASE